MSDTARKTFYKVMNEALGDVDVPAAAFNRMVDAATGLHESELQRQSSDIATQLRDLARQVLDKYGTSDENTAHVTNEVDRLYGVALDAATALNELQRRFRENDAKTMTTYRRADGEPIAGEYSWVGTADYLPDEAGDYLEVIEESWQLVDTKTLVFGDLSRWCAECDEDVDLEQPVKGPVYCSEHKPNTEEQL
jgi:hypothetical protein